MAKNWKPKPFKLPDPFKPLKEKTPKERHVMTEYERKLIPILCGYIKKKQVIQFWYEDTTKKFNDWRIVEPHLIGELKTTGNIILSGWFEPTGIQIAAGENSKWGNYILGNISKISGLNQIFRFSRSGYN